VSLLAIFSLFPFNPIIVRFKPYEVSLLSIFSLRSLPSLASQSSNNGTNNVNPLSLLTALRIDSDCTIATADWKLLQIVRMGLTGMLGGTSNGSIASTTDFIVVTIIPYTDK